MTDTTTLIQRLREDLPKVNEPESQFSCVATPDIRQAADALEQQAAQIKALRADADRYRWLCRNNFDREKMQVHTWIQTWEPHSQTGEPTQWTQRVRGGAYLSEVIDAALRQEQPNE